MQIQKPDSSAYSDGTDLAPTPHQQEALDALLEFALEDGEVFILSGAAGTGKTTLMRAFVGALARLKRPVRLLAPTGRAARILSDRTGRPAATVHSHVYAHRETRLGRRSLSLRFEVKPNEDPPDTVYVIDEASMVADASGAPRTHLDFGTGRLLRDLVTFSGVGNGATDRRIVFVGDSAQLPPVGEPFSPALIAPYVRSTYGLTVDEAEVTEVLRHASGGAILDRAARVRDAILSGDLSELDIEPDGREIIAGAYPSLVDDYLQAADDHGPDGAVIITRTNRAATALNVQIRRAKFNGTPSLVPGDRLVVVQNNPLRKLFNGDFVEVTAVDRLAAVRRPLQGSTLRFRDVTLRDLSTEREIDTLLIENALAGDSANLSPSEQQALVVDFQQRHHGVRPGSDDFDEALRNDPYLNAVRARYGYAVTCHKAQGGEWPVAFVCFDRTWQYRREEDFRWIYTAITRAKSRLVTVGAG